MYIIIKRDKAEHLKEKMHHIKTAAMEVLECIEEAASKHYDRMEEYNRDMARRNMARRDDYQDDYDYEDDRYTARRGRGRGRY